MSSGNVSATGTTHSALAQAALESDDIYCAYYHAECAREAGEPPQEYAASLMTALGFMNMWQEAANYFHSFRSNGISNARIELIYARLLAFSREPEEALRNLHYQLDDMKYIEPARRALQQACALGRFHQPEAFHHLGTLAIATGDWPEAQSCCEQALAIQNNPITLKNLVLSLHAQGKMDEAKKQYSYLSYSNRDVANTISQYFQ